jgi:hypothetical protein
MYFKIFFIEMIFKNYIFIDVIEKHDIFMIKPLLLLLQIVQDIRILISVR